MGIYSFFEFSTGAEGRGFSSRNLNNFTILRVAAFTGGSLGYFKSTETYQLNPIT